MTDLNVVPKRRGATLVLPSLLGLLISGAVALSAVIGSGPAAETPAVPVVPPATVIAWNDLGMHCIDPDFSVFSILPPFNTLNAHVVIDGELVESGAGYSVTYESIADANGSINTTSDGKTNFWDHVQDLFGVSPPVDEGLTGNRMPGPFNLPQPMTFDGSFDWFQGEGIPLTPFDDAHQKNPYPLMKVVVRNASGAVVASTVTTAPNSQELECSACHASGASPFARPAAGWAFHPDPLKDDRFNILRLHDERHLGQAPYQAALSAAGYSSTGLFDTVVNQGTSILCARCHGSNALPGTGTAGISPLTQAMHARHAYATREDGQFLEAVSDRTSCFLCHPGRDTQCLRGAMGKAVGPDGNHSMHCQSCHGSMSDVGDPNRVGWLDQPTCQNCHPGTATQNPGQIRYTTVFDANGDRRTPTTQTFATDPDTPQAGFSLYRLSKGHEGLQCSACHGPPHAIYPTDFANDNVQSQMLQGHEGTITDCTVCHDDLEDEEYEGPHGMHPASQKWVVDVHKDAVSEQGQAYCQACHGADGSGTALSLVQGDRTYNTSYGQHTFFRGSRIGCYACHDGPNGGNQTTNGRPTVPALQVSTPSDVPLPLTLTGTDPDLDPLTFRIISQPRHGTVAISGAQVDYLPNGRFQGEDEFTYAAWDGKIDSNLGTVAVTVAAPSCAGVISRYGFGDPGTGYVNPQLDGTGCPSPGEIVTLTVSEALPGASAVFGFGTQRKIIETPFGNILRVGGVFAATPLLSVAPDGTLTLPLNLPTNFPSGTYTMQVFLEDPGAPSGFSSTNGLEVVVGR